MDIKNEIKSWSIWGWLKKWGSILLTALLVVAVIIIVLLSGARYAAGSCAESIGVDKSKTDRIIDRCRENDRGEFILNLKDRKLVPKEFTIYEILRYRETGIASEIIKPGKK